MDEGLKERLEDIIASGMDTSRDCGPVVDDIWREMRESGYIVVERDDLVQLMNAADSHWGDWLYPDDTGDIMERVQKCVKG